MQIGDSDPRCLMPFERRAREKEVRESHDRGRAPREPGWECGTTVHAGFTGDLAGSFRDPVKIPRKERIMTGASAQQPSVQPHALPAVAEVMRPALSTAEPDDHLPQPR
jgi:hypothetical protein